MHVAWGWGGAGGAPPFFLAGNIVLNLHNYKKMNYHGVAIPPPFLRAFPHLPSPTD